MKKDRIKYSQVLSELEDILEGMQQESIDVDELSLKVKRAIDLIKICREKIEKTEFEVKDILEKFETRSK